MPKVTNEEHAALDLMDAYLQLLLALTWQNMQSDGLGRLVALRQMVTQKLSAYPQIFDSDRERFNATSQVLISLQQARRCSARDAASHALHQWTTFPSYIDLPHLHRQGADRLVKYAATLALATRERVESQVPRRELKHWVGGAVVAMAEDLGFPLYIPALTDLIVFLASRPGRILTSVLRAELSRYRQVAEKRLADDRKLMIRSQIVTELQSVAHDIDLRIDQSYLWDDLANFSGETSLRALDLYTQLNFHGRIKDAHFSQNTFSQNTIRKDAMPSEEFEQHFSPWFVRGLAYMMSGYDRDTRRMNRRVIDTERLDVRVNGRHVSKSLVLVVPYDDRKFDIERQLALFLLRLDRQRRSCDVGRDGDKSVSFFEGLSLSLRQLIDDGGMRRKIVDSKKSLLFCLAGLIADNIYRYRDRHKTLLSDGKPLKTMADAYEHTVTVLRDRGFHYSAESLRRGRTRFRQKYLEGVPTIFDLDEPEPDGKELAR